MSSAAISVQELGKLYQLSHENGQQQSFREAVTAMALAPFRRFRELQGSERSLEDFWALRGVTFDVQPGEVVGIIGRNGAGKSTLLKILSRIVEPTEGRAILKGRVASLLEVGTGFHPELSGRENIYLNGSILGMKKQQIDAKFDEMVAFAEVEQFLDTPVKRYSSGMYVRLAFAVAAHMEPQILVVDEVLAVGDAEFQKKCLGKMKEVTTDGGRTVLFVSHNMAAVRTLCSSAILLDHGRMMCAGSVDNVLAMYTGQFTHGDFSEWNRSDKLEGKDLAFQSATVRVMGLQPELRLEIDTILTARTTFRPAFVTIDVCDSFGVAIMQAIPNLTPFIIGGIGRHQVKITINLPPTVPGRYGVTLWVGRNSETIDLVTECLAFEIVESPQENRTIPHSSVHGYIVPPSSCTYEYIVECQ